MKKYLECRILQKQQICIAKSLPSVLVEAYANEKTEVSISLAPQ
jgi:hypothetical protein